MLSYALFAHSESDKTDLNPGKYRAGASPAAAIRLQGKQETSTFGKDLTQSLNEALDHAKFKGPAIVHAPMSPREVRKDAKLTQTKMAALMGMSLSGYGKWEPGRRRVSGPATVCFYASSSTISML